MRAEASAMDVGGQYEAARNGAACIDLAERGVLAVTGPKRLDFLHNILSNDVKPLAAGAGCLAALLDVKGHVLAMPRVSADGDAVLLETLAEGIAALEAAFVHYRVGTPVRFQARATRVLGLLGPEGAPRLTGLGLEVPPERGESHVAGSALGTEVRVIRATDMPGAGLVLHATADGGDALLRALVDAGAPLLGREALDALRVEAGRPWFGRDVTSDNLLHETGLLAQYHSPTKGCYVGQEVVARLEGRGGNVNRRLCGLRLGAPAADRHPVLADGRELGRITTAAVSPRLGPIALAYVHRSHFEPGTMVEVGGAPATVVALPFET